MGVISMDVQDEPVVRFAAPSGHFVMGVPPRDLLAVEWDALTDDQRRACLDSGAYELIETLPDPGDQNGD